MSFRMLINCLEGLNHASKKQDLVSERRRVFLFNLHVTKYLWALCITRETRKLLSEPFKILILDLLLLIRYHLRLISPLA